jgi:hypothetical protein
MKTKANLSIKRPLTDLLILLILWIILFYPMRITGQEIADIDPELQGSQQNIASVKVDGHLLFYIRGISSFSSQDRSVRIAKRIINAASNHAILSDS